MLNQVMPVLMDTVGVPRVEAIRAASLDTSPRDRRG